MSDTNGQYIYGPVPSRRLGQSLGVDLAPFKVCSFDCIYCQLGRTTKKTIKRSLSAPCDFVIEQLKSKLECKPDYIAFAGSGEPTLCSNIGEIIAEIKRITDAIDNGSIAVLEITGLWQIGKSSIIRKALAQSGVRTIFHVRLTKTSSIEYLLYSIIKQGGGDLAPPYDDPLLVANGQYIAKAMASTNILYI